MRHLHDLFHTLRNENRPDLLHNPLRKAFLRNDVADLHDLLLHLRCGHYELLHGALLDALDTCRRSKCSETFDEMQKVCLTQHTRPAHSRGNKPEPHASSDHLMQNHGVSSTPWPPHHRPPSDTTPASKVSHNANLWIASSTTRRLKLQLGWVKKPRLHPSKLQHLGSTPPFLQCSAKIRVLSIGLRTCRTRRPKRPLHELRSSQWTSQTRSRQQRIQRQRDLVRLWQSHGAQVRKHHFVRQTPAGPVLWSVFVVGSVLFAQHMRTEQGKAGQDRTGQNRAGQHSWVRGP